MEACLPGRPDSYRRCCFPRVSFKCKFPQHREWARLLSPPEDPPRPEVPDRPSLLLLASPRLCLSRWLPRPCPGRLGEQPEPWSRRLWPGSKARSLPRQGRRTRPRAVRGLPERQHSGHRESSPCSASRATICLSLYCRRVPGAQNLASDPPRAPPLLLHTRRLVPGTELC